MNIDWVLFKLLNGLAGHSTTFDTVVRMLINDYAVPTALVLVLFALWFSGTTEEQRHQNQRAALSAVTSMLLANLFIKLLNLVLYRPRPFATHEVTLLFYRPSDSSFPSNAASVGFSIATAVWLFNRKAGTILYVLAALMALARLCGGVHYPSDILAGALIGTLSALFIVRKLRFVGHLWSMLIRQMQRFLLA